MATPTKAPRATWALYLGTRMVADGAADGRAACTKPAMEAAYADAAAQGLKGGSEIISGYRISIWGPRQGNLEHMRPL